MAFGRTGEKPRVAGLLEAKDIATRVYKYLEIITKIEFVYFHLILQKSRRKLRPNQLGWNLLYALSRNGRCAGDS
jgi:hypothetical protein